MPLNSSKESCLKRCCDHRMNRANEKGQARNSATSLPNLSSSSDDLQICVQLALDSGPLRTGMALGLPHRNGLLHLCEACGLIHRDCVCDALTKVDPELEIRFLLHASELPRQSNTGGIAHAILENSSMHIHGVPGRPVDWAELVDSTRPGYLFYPTPNAEVASPTTFAGVENPYLVVLDGTWPQARRMFQKNSALHGLKKLCLPAGPAHRWKVRGPYSAAKYCTLEALILLFEALGKNELCATLWRSLELVQDRLMKQRGM